MHYHYFTIEQRETLSRVMQGMLGEDREKYSALERLRAPDYGVCEVCESDVPYVRLLDDPLARRCGRCETST